MVDTNQSSYISTCMRPMSLPIHRQDEAMAARYCLVPVSFDTTTSHVSLPDGTSIPISERIKKDVLLSAEEAEKIRPGIAHNERISHLTSLLTFRQDHGQVEEAKEDVLAPPVVSPEVEVDAKAKQTARSFRDLSGPKKSLFRSSSKSSNRIAGSKVLDVEAVEAPPGGKIQCIDLCDSSDDDKDDEESVRLPRRLACATRSKNKKKRKGGGTMRPKKTIKRKARYTLSAPGFSSDEDGHESDSTFEGSEEASDAAQLEEEASYAPVLRPISIRRDRLKHDKERDDGSSEDSRDDDDDHDDEDDDEKAGLLTSDDNASSDAIDVQLYCSWCGVHHNKDDFSLQQQANHNDEGRYCLLHHNVGHQTKYEGTSSVRKFSSQLDMIGEKYKDVGSDDDIIGDSDTCMSDEDDDEEEEVEEENISIDSREEIPKASPTRRIKRKAEDEESDSDEDDFGEEQNERLHTQPPHILHDEDDEEGIGKGRNGGNAKHCRRIIYDD